MALNERDSLLASNPLFSNSLESKLKGRKWLRALLGRVLSDYDSREVRRINFEPLESRQLMASDFFDSTSLAADSLSIATKTSGYAYYSQFSNLQAEGEGDSGEGEDAPNLVEFAKALTQAGVRFFGADWCPICTQQKELFEEGQVFLPFLEGTLVF